MAAKKKLRALLRADGHADESEGLERIQHQDRARGQRIAEYDEAGLTPMLRALEVPHGIELTPDTCSEGISTTCFIS